MNRRILIPAIAGILGVAILLGLGLWQVQRLERKSAMIAEIEARMAAQPVPLPDAPDRESDRLLRVTVEGRLGSEELHFLTSVRPWGAGYRVVSPLELAGGRRILVDLGFVPQDMKEPASRPGASTPSAPLRVTGPLLWPQEADSFTPDPDIGRNIWFARDVDAMAAALDTEPVLVVAETSGAGDWPRPVPPGVDLPNRHLEYALTWFGLAIAWAAMTVILIRAELRGRTPPDAAGPV